MLECFEKGKISFQTKLTVPPTALKHLIDKPSKNYNEDVILRLALPPKMEEIPPLGQMPSDDQKGIVVAASKPAGTGGRYNQEFVNKNEYELQKMFEKFIDLHILPEGIASITRHSRMVVNDFLDRYLADILVNIKYFDGYINTYDYIDKEAHGLKPQGWWWAYEIGRALQIRKQLYDKNLNAKVDKEFINQIAPFHLPPFPDAKFVEDYRKFIEENLQKLAKEFGGWVEYKAEDGKKRYILAKAAKFFGFEGKCKPVSDGFEPKIDLKQDKLGIQDETGLGEVKDDIVDPDPELEAKIKSKADELKQKMLDENGNVDPWTFAAEIIGNFNEYKRNETDEVREKFKKQLFLNVKKILAEKFPGHDFKEIHDDLRCIFNYYVGGRGITKQDFHNFAKVRAERQSFCPKSAKELGISEKEEKRLELFRRDVDADVLAEASKAESAIEGKKSENLSEIVRNKGREVDPKTKKVVAETSIDLAAENNTNNERQKKRHRIDQKIINKEAIKSSEIKDFRDEYAKQKIVFAPEEVRKLIKKIDQNKVGELKIFELAKVIRAQKEMTNEEKKVISEKLNKNNGFFDNFRFLVARALVIISKLPIVGRYIMSEELKNLELFAINFNNVIYVSNIPTENIQSNRGGQE